MTKVSIRGAVVPPRAKAEIPRTASFSDAASQPTARRGSSSTSFIGSPNLAAVAATLSRPTIPEKRTDAAIFDASKARRTGILPS